MNIYTVISDRARIDVGLVHEFLSRESYWAANVPRDVVERALENSLCFGVFVAGEQVGFARVITDYATYGYLADVFIVEAHRGRGAAKVLMGAVMSHPALSRLRRWQLITRDAHRLYEQFGFRPLAHPERQMEISVPNPYAPVSGSEPGRVTPRK